MEKLYFLLLASLIIASNIEAQSLQFSEDTVILHSCERQTSYVGMMVMYNTTGTEIPVHWEIADYRLPHNGLYALIIGGHQYVPFEDGHHFWHSEDTSEVIFYMWNDTLLPGDSSITQIRIWDDSDSINTAIVLTAIQVCPLSTGESTLEQQEWMLYPNPSDGYITIQSSGITSAAIKVYSMSGELVQHGVIGPIEHLDMSAIGPGMYMFTLWDKERLLAAKKILVGIKD